MKSGYTSLLPVFAVLLAVFGILYSACQDSKADSRTGEMVSLTKELKVYESKLEEVIKIHESHVASYTNQMGATSESQALFVINEHQSKIDHHKSRISYHKLQLVQADTTNANRNTEQLKELQSDFNQLLKDLESIRTGIDNTIPAHFSK